MKAAHLSIVWMMYFC